MRAGKLRHTIAIQEEVSTPDGMGGFTLEWQNVTGMDSVPAAIWPLSSKEKLDAMKKELQVDNKIRIRWRDGITSKNRIVFKTRIFDIVSFLNPDEKDINIDMICFEDI